jgi:hypothetical protein
MANIDIFPILRDVADDIIERAQRNLGATRSVKTPTGKRRNRRADSTGNLRRSLKATIRSNSGGAVISLGASGTARNYFKVVNDGRKAGKMPPVSAIEKWMKVKPVRLRNEKGFIKQTPEKVRAVAYQIARSIGKNGIAPFPYYDDAIRDVLDERRDEIIQAIEKEIDIRLKTWQ